MSLKKYLLAGGLSTILILGACGNGDEEVSEEETTEETEDTESEDTGEEDVDAAEEDAEDSDSEEDTDEDSESEDDAADSDEDSEDESSVDLDSDDEDSSSSLGAIDDADTDEAVDEDATDGEEESKTFVLEENGTYNELVYYYVGDEVTRQTSVTEMDYEAIGAANEEEARELMDEFAEEYTDTDGVEHNIDYGEDGFVETTEVNYDEADFTEVSDLEGAEFEGEETADFVSMERSEQQLLSSGYELTEGEPASGSDSDPASGGDSSGSASNIDFSSITDETLSGDETEISSMFELNSGIAERLDEVEESDADIEELLKPSDEITSYYSETYMVIHAFAGGSDTPAESDVAGLNAEIDESDGFEVYSEVFDTAAGEFLPNIYANADQLAAHDGAGWVDQTGIAESEEVYYGNYSNLYDAFMETSDVIDISEDDDYYFLHNIGTEASLDEVFGSLFNVEYTGANTDEMVNAIVGIVDKSTGEFAHVAYISTAPGQENPEEQLHIEISAQFDQYGEFDDTGITVPDVPASGSAGEEEVGESSETVEDGLAVGDSAEFEGVTMTVDDASYTDERNEFAEVDADEVLMLELSIENNTGENYMPSSLDMEVLIDGLPAETYPVGDVILDETADGDSSSGTLAYAVTGDPSEIEFVFSPSSTEDSAIFDITPE